MQPILIECRRCMPMNGIFTTCVTMLGKALFETALQRGLDFVDSHLVLETNTLMRAECEHLGGVVYKRYRIYQKRLS